jgi:PleD family two-component response regulator
LLRGVEIAAGGCGDESGTSGENDVAESAQRKHVPAMEKRAIIVDDEPSTCELIEKVLTSPGIESKTLTKSEEAPEILAAQKLRRGVP